MTNYSQPGEAITLTAPADVLSGAGVLVGSIFGVAKVSALSGAEVEVQTCGVLELAKVSAQAWATVGLLIYWDNTAKLCTTVSSGNKLIGVNTATAANPTSTGFVRLNGAFIS